MPVVDTVSVNCIKTIPDSYWYWGRFLRMNVRGQLYLAGVIGASISYIFNVLAFTGEFNVIRWGVFIALFLVVFVGFEKLIAWAESSESD